MVTITHAKVQTIADDPKAQAKGEVLPSDWNAAHVDQMGNSLHIRTILSAATTYYVRIGGDDNNDGSLALPWATIQHAWDWLNENIDGGGNFITIDIGAGRFLGASLLATPLNTSYVQFNGAGIDVTTITSLQATGYTCFDLNNVFASFWGMTFEMSSPVSFGGFALVADGFPVNVGCANCKFNGIGAASPVGACFAIQTPGAIYAIGFDDTQGQAPIYVTGNWANFLRVFPNGNQGYVEFDNTINFVGTPDFSDAVFRSLQSTALNFLTLSFSGAFTGQQFNWGGFVNIGAVTLGQLITALGGGTTGVVQTGLEYAALSLSALPTTADLAPGGFAVVKDTGGGGVYTSYNDAGTIKSSLLSTAVGISTTATLAALSVTGTRGSITFTNGIATAVTSATT